MLSSLAERIHDGRFLRLMRNMLKAGYLEDWVWNATLSGVPQGGVVSPVMSNIYLHRLDRLMERATAHDPTIRPSAAEMAKELRLIMSGTFSEDFDIPDAASLRQELSVISDTVQRDADRSRRRVDAANRLFSNLIAAGGETIRRLNEAGAPLNQKQFGGENDTILNRASNLVLVPPPAFWKGACVVTSLPYNTGTAGRNSQTTLFLWSGFGMLANVHDDAGLVAAHVLANSVIWMDSKLVKLESMEAEQAVADLAMDLATHAIEALTMFLKEYKRVTT